MSLEQYQALHNSHIAASGNSSASLDPRQQPNDANELLIKGASLAGAGRELGLSEEETLAAVSRSFRKQGTKDAIRARRRSEAEAQSTWSQKQASLGDWGNGEIAGVGYEDQSEIERAFGQDQSDYQNFRADDTGFTSDEETGLIRRESFDESRGESVDMAPKSALRDALAGLEREASRQSSGMGGSIARVFGGSGVDSDTSTAMDALRQHLQSEAPADARVGRALVRGDNKRFDSEAAVANNFRAAAEAEAIARDGYTVNGSGAMADEAIGRIAEIRSLGKIGETAHVIRTANDAIQGQATQRADGVYLDPVSNNPIASQGPELPPMRGSDRTPNNGSSSNSLNAPQTAREWVTTAIPDYRESARTFGDYPQVDITMQTTNFANKVRDYGEKNNIPELTQVSSNIRSIDELEKVVQFIAGKRAASGQGLTVPNPEIAGASMPAGTNTTGGVMNALNVTLGEQQQLANAMFQLDAAQRSSVNENPTGTYLSRMTKQGPQPMGQSDIVFDAAEAINSSEGQARVATIPKGSTIGVRDEGSGKVVRRTIVNELANLPGGPSVQKPFIGQVAGEKPRVNRRKPGGMGSGDELQANIQRQAESRAKGKPVDQERVNANITKARLAEEREERDARRRAIQKDSIRNTTPGNIRPIRR